MHNFLAQAQAPVAVLSIFHLALTKRRPPPPKPNSGHCSGLKQVSETAIDMLLFCKFDESLQCDQQV